MLDYDFKLLLYNFYLMLPSDKLNTYSKSFLCDAYLKVSNFYDILKLKPYHLSRLPKATIIVLLDDLIFKCGLSVRPDE